MKLQWYWAIGIGLLVVAGCNDGHPSLSETSAADGPVDAALSDDQVDELFDHALTFMERSGDVIERDAADCPAMGRDLEVLRQKNDAMIRQVQHVYGSSVGEHRKALEHRYHDRYHAAWAKIRPGIMKCKNVPEVNKVVHELSGG